MTPSTARPARIQTTARPARIQKAIRKPGAARKPKPAHDRATLIFRDFVQQLEKLDSRPARAAREGAR